MNILGVRPYPANNESLTGYLLRLASLHGLDGVSELLRIIQVKKPKSRRFGLWSVNELHDALTALGPVLNRDKTCVFPSLPHLNEMGWNFSQTRVLSELYVDFPRVCPHCLDIRQYIDWRWGIGTVARCIEHNELLIDTCPACDSALEWKSKLLRGCTHCDYKWSQFPSSSWCHVAFSPLEGALFPDENGDIKANSEALNAVCVMIIATARPFDSLIQSFQRIPYTKTHSELLLNALALLEHSQQMQHWVNLRLERSIDEQRLGEEIPFLIRNRIPDLLTYVTATEQLQPNFEFVEHIEYVRPARVKLVKNNDKSALRYHLSHADLARRLKLSKADLLHTADTIKSINGTSVIRDQLYDSRLTIDYLSVFVKRLPPINWVLITTKEKILRIFLCPFGKLLRAILAKEITGSLVSTDDLSSVNIEPKQLYNWLMSNFKRECEGTVSIVNVAKALTCGPEKVKILVESGELQYAAWQRAGNHISGASLYKYWSKKNRPNQLKKLINQNINKGNKGSSTAR
jgi:hypothetical protein